MLMAFLYFSFSEPVATAKLIRGTVHNGVTMTDISVTVEHRGTSTVVKLPQGSKISDVLEQMKGDGPGADAGLPAQPSHG